MEYVAQSPNDSQGSPTAQSMEGWYTDPYARHEARWMSRGTPTRLVRDGKFEGSDPVTDEPFKVNPVRVDVDGPPT